MDKFDSNKSYRCSKYIKSTGFTFLMYLVIKSKKINNCNVELYKYILSHRDELDKQNTKGWTALMIACRNKYLNVADILLELGANIDLQNNDGYCALMYAYKQPCLVKKLINAEANVNLKNKYGFPVYFYGMLNINSFKILINSNVDLKLKCNGKSGFELLCKFFYKKQHEELVKYCLDIHNYYDEVDLLKCIMLGWHKEMLVMYLANIYFKKVNCFKLY